jgi:hypothetical protein
MRPVRYILDLPWWVGLAIFMGGNWVTGHSYILGVPICLFGAWTFSKLLKPNDDPEPFPAIVGFPLFFLVMLIPSQFAFKGDWFSWMNGISENVLYGTRAALGIFTGFIAFQGVRK